MSYLPFDQPYYTEINMVRWAMASRVLDDLQRQLAGELRSCIDIACGPGWFAERLSQTGLEVVGIEGRAELVAEAAKRVPNVSFRRVDVESEEETHGLGTFDLVFCFGLLYHVENPFRVIRNLENLTGRVLFIETMAFPSEEPILRFVDEGTYLDQGLTFRAVVPSKTAFVKMLRAAGFSWVAEYTGRIEHPDFIESSEQHRRRRVFLAARSPLDVTDFAALPEVETPIFGVAKTPELAVAPAFEEGSNDSLYVTPRIVTSLAECNFYHAMDLPDVGAVGGMWDLRDNIGAYLGNYDFGGKRCLDIGTASGFLSFEMERRGASEVVSVDVDSPDRIELVDFADPTYSLKQKYDEYSELHEGIQNSYWFAHRVLDSRAKAYYGTGYDLPDTLGMFDVVVIGMMLPHVRDPFRVLEQAAARSSDTIIVVQQAPQVGDAYAYFMPDPVTLEPHWAWWSMSEDCVARMLNILGFKVVSKIRAEYACPYRGDTETCTTQVAVRMSSEDFAELREVASRSAELSAEQVAVQETVDHSGRQDSVSHGELPGLAEVLQQQAEMLSDLRRDREAQVAIVHQYEALLKERTAENASLSRSLDAAEAVFKDLRATRGYRLMRLLGRWKSLERGMRRVVN